MFAMPITDPRPFRYKTPGAADTWLIQLVLRCYPTLTGEDLLARVGTGPHSQPLYPPYGFWTAKSCTPWTGSTADSQTCPATSIGAHGGRQLGP